MRYCLEFYWQQGSACLMPGLGLTACFPPRNRKGMWRPGRLQPCQESPAGPAGALGEAQGGPALSPQALPAAEVLPWKGTALEASPAPTAGPAPGRLWGTAGRAALGAGHSHWCCRTAPPCRAALALPALQPLGLQQLSPALLGAPSSSSAQALRCVCVTPRAQPALHGGSKPYSTTARHPSQAWRGWGEQGVHVINIKSATKKRHILYIFDPYTQEHNIHRTPRRSGDVVRRFLRDVAPLPAPPLCLPVPTEHQSPEVPPGWHTALQVGVGGVLVPRRACPAALGER